MKENTKCYTLDEAEDIIIGKKGTPRRDAYDADIAMFLVGKALREARKSRHLTQEQVGQLVGVQKAQISRIENGNNLTLSTIVRYLKSLGMQANLSINTIGDVALA